MIVWVWCKSLHTGHRFDIPLQRLDALLERGAVAEIPGRRRRAAGARAPKFFVPMNGRRPSNPPASRPDKPKE